MTAQPQHTQPIETEPKQSAWTAQAIAHIAAMEAEMPVATVHGNPWSFGEGLIRPWNRDYREFPSI